MFGGIWSLPYWDQNMEFDIESWVPYRCDFRPIKTNSLFSETLGSVAEMAMMLGSELLYMWCGDDCPVGTLAPENLIRSSSPDDERSGFAIVFSYSPEMEKTLHDLAESNDLFGAGVTVCGIWRSEILLEECKVLAVASDNPLFDPEEFLRSLLRLPGKDRPRGNVPYFAEKFGYRRFSIPYETDNVTELQISNLLMTFEFEETKQYVGPMMELSMEDY